jgi:hypothetical protein
MVILKVYRERLSLTFVSFLRPNNLSQKMMWVILSIYMTVTCLITSMQFLTEYLKTKGSILNELKQLDALIAGLTKKTNKLSETG